VPAPAAPESDGRPDRSGRKAVSRGDQMTGLGTRDPGLGTRRAEFVQAAAACVAGHPQEANPRTRRTCGTRTGRTPERFEPVEPALVRCRFTTSHTPS